MFRKKFFVVSLMLISVFLISGAVSFADELTDIQAAIKAKGAKWVAGKTSMMNLSPEERKMRLGLLEGESVQPAETFAGASPETVLSATYDWRNIGGTSYVTPVRDQGNCGSCWAFATTAALEAVTLIAQDTPDTNFDTAEQILVSCSGAGSCSGGYIGSASSFIRNTGLPGESCYPYTATNGNCSNACQNWQLSTYKIVNYYGVSTNIDAIKNALVTYGPLVTTMRVFNDFFSYSGGVYLHVSGNFAGNHAILIVGYDDNNQCFIVKNSWGTWWGEAGYFRIAYSQIACSLNTDVCFAQGTLAYVITPVTPTLSVSAPNGGEQWMTGRTYTIKWTYTGDAGTSVMIELYDGQTYRTITTNTPVGSSGSGSYSWTIPSDQAVGSNYFIRVTSNKSISDTSNNPFTITTVTTSGVSGIVTTSSGTGLSGVTMSFRRVSGTGALPGSVQTGSDGRWSQTGFESGTTYKVAPARSGYSFSPKYLTFSGVNSSLNFIGRAKSRQK